MWRDGLPHLYFLELVIGSLVFCVVLGILIFRYLQGTGYLPEDLFASTKYERDEHDD